MESRMNLFSLKQLRERYQIISQQAMAEGKVPWFHPEWIEKQAIVSLLIKAKKLAHGKLLDVGCAEKPYNSIFSDVVSHHFGIDLPFDSSSAIDAYGSVFEIPIKTSSMDTVLCTQVIEHLPEPQKAFDEMYRVLRRGGVLILTAPMAWELHAEPFDFFRYTRYGLKSMAVCSGFKVEYIEATTGSWGVIGQRLSSIAYQMFGLPKMFVGLGIKLFLCFIIQRLFLILDRAVNNKKETLGNILVARK